jgi:C4-dicarboxylate-specific signal transduction histidine kinase
MCLLVLPLDGRTAGVLLVLQAVAIVLMGLALRRRSQESASAEDRLRFERLMGELSAELSTVPTDRVDEAVGRWVARLGSHFEADRVALVQFSDHSTRLHPTHTSDAGPWPPLPDIYEAEELPILVGGIRQGRVVKLSRMAELPASPGTDQATLKAAAVQALVAAPLAPGGQALGFLALMMTRRERHWSAETVLQLQLVTSVVGSALLRRNNERSLRSIDALSGAVLSSLSARVAVLDGTGTVVRANEAWLAPERSNGIAWAPVGQNYLVACRGSADHDPGATELARGIESVLAGQQAGVRLECATSTPAGEHWYEVVAEPLRRPTGGAVVMLTDLTARKRAELEAQQHRAEAAHAARAATLGELAAGLAHELNQPLAAIMTNVQASRRLLTSDQPPMALVGEILDDIASDDVRAVEIIRRMRALLVKGQMDVQPLDLNELVGDVLRLVASDAILRRIRVHRRVEPDLPGITGDRVQLQQVILNLVVNGLEAMSEMPAPRRHLTIETDLRDDGLVALTVRDHGPGIAPELLGKIYEPFFSTKSDGLGMGLSICRSIAEAHGGRLRAANHPSGGAVFEFALPVATVDRPPETRRIQERRTYASDRSDSLHSR